MRASTSDRSAKRGLWIAGVTGLGAAVALVLWPHQERFILQGLTAVWCRATDLRCPSSCSPWWSSCWW